MVSAPNFTTDKATVNGASIHYVRDGQGPPLVLIHGFPQDWSEFQAIIPRLAQKFTIIAPDLRGIGQSKVMNGGYDAATMAEDVSQLISNLHLGRPYVVGHDLGGQVAYALARRSPEILRGVMIVDSPLPGVDGWTEVQANPALWHALFMQTPNLPEKLLSGRQADFLEYFFTFSKFSPEEKTRFIEAYGTDAKLHAALEMYRAMETNAKFNAAQQGKIDLPIILAAGERSPFAQLLPKMAEGLRKNGCTQVSVELIAGAVHYIVEDQPDRFTDLIECSARQ
jgi:pimeloyl-ACP methyl ester carboxylesterase